MNHPDAGFDAEDLKLLTAVLATNPSMESTARAAKIIETELLFPIEHHQLLQLFDDHDHHIVGACRITREHVGEHLPAEAFPIDNRTELISRLVMAFERARIGELTQVFGPEVFRWEAAEHGER